jgi:molybdate transport system permease protein
MPSLFSASLLPVIWLTLKVALVATFLLLIPGIFLGWLLARKEFPGCGLLSALVHVPLVIPPVATGYLLLVLLGPRSFVGEGLQTIFGVRLAFSWLGAALAAAIVALPLMVRSIRIAVEKVDPKLEQAARTLGAGRLDTFFNVTLPMAAPGVVAGSVLAFARSMGEFGATIIFAGNIAGQTRTLPLAIFSTLQIPGKDREVFMLALVSIVVSLVAILLSEWVSRRCSWG